MARDTIGGESPPRTRSTNGTIVAAGSRTPDKAGEFAVEFGAERAHGSYDELVADSNSDRMPWEAVRIVGHRGAGRTDGGH